METWCHLVAITSSSLCRNRRVPSDRGRLAYSTKCCVSLPHHHCLPTITAIPTIPASPTITAIPSCLSFTSQPVTHP